MTRMPCSKPSDFRWVAKQNPGLAQMNWRDAAALAGAIVSTDILSRLEAHIFDDENGQWQIHIMADGYTDTDEEAVPPILLADALGQIDLKILTPEREVVMSLVKTLRIHADRIEAKMNEKTAQMVSSQVS